MAVTGVRAEEHAPSRSGAGCIELADHHRPQEDRHPVPGQLVRVLRDRRHLRAADADASWPGPAPRSCRPHALQPGLHDARHADDLPGHLPAPVRASGTTSCRCRSARSTWRSRASTRCRSGCCRSAGSRSCRASSPRAARPPPGGPATSRCREQLGTGQDLWILGLMIVGTGLDPGRDQLHRDDPADARARDDHDAAADLHVEHPGHVAAGGAGHAGRHRRADHAVRRPPARHHLLRSDAAGASCSCGSTCSGSSATPRSTC